MDFHENDLANLLHENSYTWVYIRATWYNMYNNNYYKSIYIALNHL